MDPDLTPIAAVARIYACTTGATRRVRRVSKAKAKAKSRRYDGCDGCGGYDGCDGTDETAGRAKERAGGQARQAARHFCFYHFHKSISNAPLLQAL